MTKSKVLIIGLIIWGCGSNQSNNTNVAESNESTDNGTLFSSSSRESLNSSSFIDVDKLSSVYINSSSSSLTDSKYSSQEFIYSSSLNASSSISQMSSSLRNSSVSSAALSSSITLSSSSFITLLGKMNNQDCMFREISSNNGELQCIEKTYKTIKIGKNIWMAENLNVGEEYYRRNDSILEKHCYNGASRNCQTDGGLYTWTEAMGLPKICDTIKCGAALYGGFWKRGENQGICPNGWHIPIIDEWNTLMNDGGGQSLVGMKMKLNNTGFKKWDDYAYNDGNSLGFSAFPAGYRNPDGNYTDRGTRALFVDAAEFDEESGYHHYLSQSIQYLALYPSVWKKLSISVRCIKDSL